MGDRFEDLSLPRSRRARLAVLPLAWLAACVAGWGFVLGLLGSEQPAAWLGIADAARAIGVWGAFTAVSALVLVWALRVPAKLPMALHEGQLRLEGRRHPIADLLRVEVVDRRLVLTLRDGEVVRTTPVQPGHELSAVVKRLGQAITRATAPE
ncbi:MAG: hypothetical protein EP330_07155 [Deltaproteobacteria bacterium]|nr:MAG: hypothetical protein EP330_07155 [Deltaproteobacteria bacterium]